MNLKIKSIISLLVLIVICILIGVLRNVDQEEQIGVKRIISSKTMGTTYSVSFVDTTSSMKEEDLFALQEKIDGVLNRVNMMMSIYESNSDIMNFNNYKGTDWYEIPEELYQLIKEAISISERTGGYYDITVGDLVKLWQFGPESSRIEDDPSSIPSEKEIHKVLEYTGYKKIAVKQEGDKFFVKKSHPKIFLDLSSIAKGYGADLVSKLLEEDGISNHLVEVGGELIARGVGADGKPFRVGIQQPTSLDALPMKVLDITGKAIATSGSYENYYTVNKKQYSHLINPITGQSEISPVLSTSVIAPTCQTADAWATALYLVKMEEGLKIANELNLGVYYIYLNEQGKMVDVWNDEFSKYLEQK